MARRSAGGVPPRNRLAARILSRSIFSWMAASNLGRITASSSREASLTRLLSRRIRSSRRREGMDEEAQIARKIMTDFLEQYDTVLTVDHRNSQKS
jgi:protein-tyrosine-phosphatase